jgi:hypothetical protein
MCGAFQVEIVSRVSVGVYVRSVHETASLKISRVSNKRRKLVTFASLTSISQCYDSFWCVFEDATDCSTGFNSVVFCVVNSQLFHFEG